MSRRRRWPVVMCLLAALVLTLPGAPASASAAPPAAAAAPGASGRTWVEVDELRHQRVYRSDPRVSCPTLTDCWAVEAGALVRSSDGGATWTDRYALLPAGLEYVLDLTCTGPDHCLLLGRTDRAPELLVVDGDRVAVRRVPMKYASTLACATASRCVAVTNDAAASTTDAGLTWRTSPLGRQVNFPRASCARASLLCVVVGARGLDGGNATVSRDGGLTWTGSSLPPGTRRLDDVDCVTPTSCRAVGDGDPSTAMVSSTDGGSTWTAAALPGGVRGLTGVSCTAEASCRAVGLAIRGGREVRVALTTVDGTGWRADILADEPTGQPYGAPATVLDVGCPGPSSCVVVGQGVGYRPPGTSARWDTVVLPTSPSYLQVLTCRSAGQCVAVGRDSAGTLIALRGVPGAFTVSPIRSAGISLFADAPESISCVARTCVVMWVRYLDGIPYASGAWFTPDGGSTWSAGTVPARTADEDQVVSCGSATSCLEINGHNGTTLRTSDGGATWTPAAPRPPDAPHPFATGVSCTVSTCVVVGTSGLASRTTDLGTTWQPVRLAPENSNARFDGVQCWGTTCLATGSRLARSTDGGATWSTLPFPAGVSSLTELACSAHGRCAAVAVGTGTGRVPAVTTDAGSTWRVDAGPALDLLACDAPTCIGTASTADGLFTYAEVAPTLP